ncbi:hypothetical protein JCGZ_13264 [Jatropha curcas]|uniref:RRM domain-containing protein n=1 Tax=Jatropha curcas TaxID=180498 RepID=A0A067KKJ9_JATCU|nr:serine/threonine-protein kinase fray2 isoform X2 [Jatropha curcas]KDP32339.1 hypothetical protein JCGZ_13264 [Jatropha curcas]
MTVDEENSIYVGGLPYNATEDTIRRVFDPYGSIVSVKIINDHGTRGKCYCFVTFRNPRSVIDAINDMNGKTIDGRAVKVNGVTSRGGRSTFTRERFRRNMDRGGVDWDRGRDRERDYDRDRERYRERYSAKSRERARSWDHDEDEDRRYELAHDHVQARDGFVDGDQSRDRDLVGNEQEDGKNNIWNWERGHDLHSDRDREMDAANGGDKLADKEKDHHLRKQIDSRYNDQHRRETSSDSSGGYNDRVKERLERSIQRRDELKKEISEIEGRLEDKQQLVSTLRKRTQKLEDALITTKKRSSQHKMQLTKLHKCFLQVKEYSERLKSCEGELQSLVDSAMIQNDLVDDVDLRMES